jgi:hypothetical protein
VSLVYLSRFPGALLLKVLRGKRGRTRSSALRSRTRVLRHWRAFPLQKKKKKEKKGEEQKKEKKRRRTKKKKKKKKKGKKKKKKKKRKKEIKHTGRLEIEKNCTYGTYLPRLQREKSARSPPAEIFDSKTIQKPMNHLFKRPKTGPKSPKRRRHYIKTADGTSIIPIRVF